MTSTITPSSSMKDLCDCLISFQLRPRISFKGKLTSSKIPFQNLMRLKKGTWPIFLPTIKLNISTKTGIVEEIMLGASCYSKEVASYKALFQEFCDIFYWYYTKIPRLDPSIIEHHIDTWPNVLPVHQKQQPIHPSKASEVKE